MANGDPFLFETFAAYRADFLEWRVHSLGRKRLQSGNYVLTQIVTFLMPHSNPVMIGSFCIDSRLSIFMPRLNLVAIETFCLNSIMVGLNASLQPCWERGILFHYRVVLHQSPQLERNLSSGWNRENHGVGDIKPHPLLEKSLIGVTSLQLSYTWLWTLENIVEPLSSIALIYALPLWLGTTPPLVLAWNNFPTIFEEDVHVLPTLILSVDIKLAWPSQDHMVGIHVNHITYDHIHISYSDRKRNSTDVSYLCLLGLFRPLGVLVKRTHFLARERSIGQDSKCMIRVSRVN